MNAGAATAADPKALALRRAKRRATALLVAAAALFVAALVGRRLAPPPWLPALGWLQAIGEAGTVGALADWFAVTALFRRVPIPLLEPHTAIVARRKDAIAESLAAFLREKFFDVEQVAALIRRHDPAAGVGAWLTAPGNAERLGAPLVRVAALALDFVDDPPVRERLVDGVREAIGRMDLSGATGSVLELLTADGRHQELLGQGLQQFAALLRRDDTQAFIADGIVKWLQADHPLKAAVLPSEWIGRQGAQVAVRAVSRLLDEVSDDADHPLRRRFDESVERFVERLRDDPATAEKAARLRDALRDSPALGGYLAGLAAQLRDRLRADLERPDSALRARVVGLGGWLGRTLAGDERLRASVNAHLEDAARAMAPDFARFLGSHVVETIRRWDARDLAAQIELNLGGDLQRIRVNGTLVGAAAGALLHAIALAARFGG